MPEEKTPNQIVNESVEKIEKALGDLKKDKATTNEVLELIGDQQKSDSEKIAAAEKKIAEAYDEVKALKDETESMKKRIRQSATNAFSGSSRSALAYKGLFRSPEEAKSVGLTMMAAALKAGTGDDAIKARRDEVLKALDDMGTVVKWIDDKGCRVKVATTSGQTTGAAMVTTEQAPGLIMLLEFYGKFRANAKKVPLAATTTVMPKLDGLLQVFVPGEGKAPTMDDVIVGLLSLTPKTMTALTAYSLELDEDSAIGLAELYGMLFARSFAYYEDLCGFLGDGTSTYFGFTGVAGALRAVDADIANIKSLIVASGNAYSEITLGDFEKLAGNLPSYAEGKHYCHKYFYYTVMIKLALASGGVNATEVLTSVGKQKSFLADPVEFTPVMPRVAANNQICNIYGDLNMGAMLGTRGGLEFASSDQRYFDQGLVALRARSRVNINVHGVGDTAEAGPINALITAGA
jgi:HK97 family phage major capsid protein